MKRFWIMMLLVLFAPAALSAQDADCPALVQQVVESVRESCPAVDANQVCYGHPSLEIGPRANVRVVFAEPGDLLGLSSIVTLTSRPFNPDSEIWGVAQMSVRADLPESALTVLAFGDLTLENLSDAPDDFIALEADVRFPDGANVRSLPAPDAELVTTLFNGAVVRVVGRLADNTWLRLPEGWVSADLLNRDLRFDLLPVYEPDAELLTASLYAPMQTIQFRSGVDERPCPAAPESGLLVQTPDGARDVTLVVNGAPLAITGTIFLQTQAEGRTILSVLEGRVIYGDGRALEAGSRLTYGYQGDNILYGQPEDYYYARARYLPLVLLPREFELPFSLGGLIFPFTPGTGFLTTVAADDPCTAAWNVDVNLRAGPGTEYPLRRGIPGGNYALPEARAVSADGANWWKLAEGVWVISDATVVAGACADLPLVAPPPLPAS